MKVAVLSSGNLENMKGIMNFVQEKCKLLQERQGTSFSVDFYLVQVQYSFWFQLLLLITRKIKKISFKKQDRQIEIDGITYCCLWVNYGIWDNFWSTKLNKKYISKRYVKTFSKILEQYDCLTTHTLICHDIALGIKKIANKPYIATWHGSDIAVTPKKEPQYIPTITEILKSSDCNLFISKALKSNAIELCPDITYDIIYTGPSNIFRRLPEQVRINLKKQYDVEGKKVILFVGNLVPVKNPLVLPEIFSLIDKGYGENNVVFWIVGNGILEKELDQRLKATGVCYKMFGKQNPESIPSIMNCADIHILPSVSEGLGLVNMEAIVCGCNAVGSKVGGIPEILGEENTFDLDENFASKVAHKCIEILQNNVSPEPLPHDFSWRSAINKEIYYYRYITKK